MSYSSQWVSASASKGGWSARLFSLIALASMVLWAGAALAGDKIVSPDELLAKIQQNGTVRVIVKFESPDYAWLASKSQEFKTGGAGKVDAEQQLSADQALAAAIKKAADTLYASLPSGSAELLHVFSTMPFMVMKINKAGLDALDANATVLRVTEDKATPAPTPIPSPSGAALSGAAAASSNLTQIGVDNAWAQGYTGAGWYVAVLDTGLLNTHEFFSGKNIVEACYTSRDNAQNPSARLCPNGQTTMLGAGSAAPYAGDSHGTHVAGIAVGKKADDSLAGVAKDANLIAVQVFSDGFSSGDPLQTMDSDSIKGLEYVYSLRTTYNIASVNMSLGGDSYSTTCDSYDSAYTAAIKQLYDVGIAVVAASGNESTCGTINHPACVSYAVAIGAVDSSDGMASFSNWAETLVPFFAPGVDIYSSVNTSTSAYGNMSGTSMATPHMAGAWALAKQRQPSAQVGTVYKVFRDTAKTVSLGSCGSPTGITRRVQVDDALAAMGPNEVATFDGRGLLVFATLLAGASWFALRRAKTHRS